MSSVDNRIVNMEFNNEQFEYGVKETIGSLDKLKDSLQLKDATLGIDKIAKSAQSIDLSSIAKNVDDLSSRFSTLGVAGMSVINKLTSGFLDFGLKTAKSLFLDPVIAGFDELATQNKSIQVIMANTGRRFGTTVSDVRGQLDELNTYADKTIYNFTQMTDNIGKFTAAGVDLDSSVSAIKGLSNLGAFMGANANVVSGAMYQMSQAMATGAVKLLDWRSMELRGMAGTEFQEDIIRTARTMGVAVDEYIEQYGGFRESLRAGWLTNDVFLESLSHFADDVREIGEDVYAQELRAKGYTEDDIQAIMYLSRQANEAATKVKSWAQLWDTLAEEAGSSWTKTWDLIFGGYEGAEQLFNGAYEMLKPFVEGIGNLRNFIVQDLVHTSTIQSIIRGLTNLAQVGKDTFEIFSDSFISSLGLNEVIDFLSSGVWDDASHIGKVLSRIGSAFERFTASLKFDESDVASIRRIFDGINSLFIFALDAFTMGATMALDIASALSPLIDIVLDIAGAIGSVIKYLKDLWLASAVTDPILRSFRNLLVPIKEFLQLIADFVHGTIDVVGAIFSKIFPDSSLFRPLKDVFLSIQDFTKGIADGSVAFFDGIRKAGTSFTTDLIGRIESGENVFVAFFKTAGDGFKTIGSKLSDVGKKIRETFGNTALFKGFDTIKSKAVSVFKSIGDAISRSGIADDWRVSFTGLSDTIQNDFKKTPISIKSVLNVCKEAILGFLNFLRTEFTTRLPDLGAKLGDFFSKLPEHISAFFGKVKDFFTGKDSSGMAFGDFVDGLKEKIGQLIEYLRDKRLLFTDKIGDFFKSAYERIKDIIPRLTEGLDVFLDSIGEALGVENMDQNVTIFDKFGAIFAAAVARLKDVAGPAIEELSGLGSLMHTALTKFVGELFTGMENIPWGDIAIVASFLALTKALNSLAALAKSVQKGPVAKIGEVLGSVKGLLDQFKTFGVELTKQVKWAFLTAFAKALPPIIAAIAALAGVAAINPGAVNQAILAVGVVLTGLYGIMERVSKTSSSVSDITKVFDFAAMAAPIMAMAGATIAISAALMMVSTIDSDKLIGSIAAIGAIWSMLMGTIAALSFDTTRISKGGFINTFRPTSVTNGGSIAAIFISMAAAIRLVAGAVKKLGNMRPSELSQGLNAVFQLWAELTAGVTAAMWVSSRANGTGLNGVKTGTVIASFIGMAVAIKLMANSVKSLSKLDIGEAITGVGSVVALMLAMSKAMSMMISAVPQGGSFKGFAGFVLALTPLMLAIIGLSKIPWDAAVVGIGTFAAAMFILAAASTKIAPVAPQLNAVGSAIMKFAAAAALIGVAALAIGKLVEIFTNLNDALSGSGTNWADAAATFIADLCKVIADSADSIGEMLIEVLVGSLENLAEATPRITEAFATVFIKALEALKAYTPQVVHAAADFMKTLMSSIATEIGNSVQGENIADAFVKVFVPTTAALIAIKQAKVGWGEVGKLLVIIDGVLVPLAACGAILQSTANEYSAGSIAAIDVMLGEIGALVLYLSKTHAIVTGFDIANAAKLALAIDVVAGIVTGGAALIEGLFGALAQAGVDAEFFRAGAASVQAIFEGIGAAIGGLIGGFGGAIVGSYQSVVSRSLPEIGKNLEQFTTNAGSFLEYFNNVDDAYVTRLGTFGDGVNNLITGMVGIADGSGYSKKISEFGTSLSKLGEKIKGFDEALGPDVDVNRFKLAAEGFKTIAEFAKTLPVLDDGAYNIEGRKQETLSEFAEEVSTFFTEVNDSMSKFNAIDNFDFTRLTEAKTFMEGMRDLGETLPESFSVWGLAFGRKSTIGEFGNMIGTAFTAIYDAMTLVNSDKTPDGRDINYDLTRLTEIKDFMAEMAKIEMPESWSVKGFLSGGNPMSLHDFAMDFQAFAYVLSNIDWSFINTYPDSAPDQWKIQKVVETIQGLATASATLGSSANSQFTVGAAITPAGGGLLAHFVDFQDIGSFARELNNHKDDIKTFFEAIEDINLPSSSRTKLSAITKAIGDLADAQHDISEAGEINVRSGGTDLSMMNLANFAAMLANGFTNKEGNTTSFLDSMQIISDDMETFDAPNLDKLSTLTESVKNLAEGYKALDEVTLPESLDTNNTELVTENAGKLTQMAEDAKGMIPALKEMAEAFGDSFNGEDLPDINTLTQAVGVIGDLADIYTKVIDPFIVDVDSTTDAWGGHTETKGKHLEYDSTVKPLVDFAGQLPGLGRALVNFQNSLKGWSYNGATADAFDADKFTEPLDLLGKFRDFGSDIGNTDWSSSGGLAQFGNMLPTLGFDLMDFAHNVEGMAGLGIYDTHVAIENAKKIGELGGKFTGWNTSDATEFANSLGPIGTGLHDFSQNIGTDFNADSVTNGMPAIEAMINSLNGLTIDDTVSEKAEKLQEVVGKIVKGFGGNTGSVGDQLAESYNNSLGTGGSTAGVGGDFASRFTTVSTNIGQFAAGISELNTALSGIPEVDMAEGGKISKYAKAISDIISAFNFEKTLTYDESTGRPGSYQITGDMTELVGNMNMMSIALRNMSDAFNSFNGGGEGIDSGGAVGAITELKDFITKLQEADLPTITENMESLSEAVKKLAGVGGGSEGSYSVDFETGEVEGGEGGGGGLQGVMDLVDKLGQTDLAGAATSIQTIATNITTIGSAGGEGGSLSSVTSFFTQLASFDFSVPIAGITSFKMAIETLGPAVSSSTSAVIAAVIDMGMRVAQYLKVIAEAFKLAGNMAANRFASGISENDAPSSAAASMANAAAFSAQSNSWSGFYSAGVMAASGMAAGIRSAAAQVAAEAAAMVTNAISAAKGAQNSHSPSRVYMEIGSWAAQGYILGMQSEKANVANSTAGVIANAIQSAYDMATNEINLNPVIEPVIDLSGAREDVSSLNQMLATTRASSLVRSVGSAAAIAKRIRDNEEIQNGSELESATTTVNNTFTQNITSPKAVSRMEVYRDTRNLFALEKGAAINEKGVTIR